MAKETIIRETSIGLLEVQHMYARGRKLKFEIVYALDDTMYSPIDLRIVIAIDMAGNRNDITKFCLSDNPSAEDLPEAIKDCIYKQIGWK